MVCNLHKVVFAFLVCFAVTAASLANVKVNSNTGRFSVFINGIKWFQSGDVFIFSNGVKYSLYGLNLKASTARKIYGEDNLGTYEEILIDYFSAENELDPLMIGSIRSYKSDDNIVFQQYFPKVLNGTSCGDADSIVSSFPSFEMFEGNGHNPQSRTQGLGYAHWISWYYEQQPSSKSFRSNLRRELLVAPGFSTPQFGLWDENTRLSGGIGGSGVTAVYSLDILFYNGGEYDTDTNLIDLSVGENTAVILAPLTNVMAVSHTSPESGTLMYGIMGNVSSIPARYSVSVLMHIGGRGVNSAMTTWGDAFRSWYGKGDAHSQREKDITLQYLGFSTDNGAYYYYNTIPGMDYEQTLVAVKEDADRNGIPYKYVLLDSWWYYKGENGGIKDWSARPDVFPNGIEALYQKTGWLVQAHNRYWAEDAIYAKQNGGDYDFIIDTTKHGSVPTGQRFWDDLLSKPSSAWGLRVYEQDWLFNEMYQYVGEMLTTVDRASTWLMQMGAGASHSGLTIQYCMPYIRFLLQSVEIPAVTQARASDDYVVSPYDGVDNWKIAGQNMLIDALGLAPSKDGYWTTSYQPNNPYGEDRFEPFPRLHSVVATLSAGPVQIADGLGYSDAELILRSCAKDGRLLQPSAPAKLIDPLMISRALQSGSKRHVASLPPADSEIWYAPTFFGRRTFGYVFVAELSTEYQLSLQYLDSSFGKSTEFRAYEWNSSSVIYNFSAGVPLLLPACDKADYQLWTLTPIEVNGWSFQGEVNKWVGVSQARFSSISTTSEPAVGMVATAIGSEGEVIQVGFINPQNISVLVTCMIDNRGKAIVYSTGYCE